MPRLVLTTTPTNFPEGTPAIKHYHLVLGSSSQDVPPPAAGATVEAMFPMPAPGDHMTSAQAINMNDQPVGALIVGPVYHVAVPVVLQIPTTLQVMES